MHINAIRFIDRKLGIPFCKLLQLFKWSSKPDVRKLDVQKILVIKMWGLGTITLCSPTFRALRKRYPHAKIYFLTMSNNRGLYEGNDFFDEIIYFPVNNLFQMAMDGLRLLRRLRSERLDLVIDLEIIARFTALLSYFSNAKTSIGFDPESQGRGGLFDIKVPYHEYGHITESFLEVLKPLGIVKPDLTLEKPYISNEDKKYVEDLLKRHKIKTYCAVNVNTSNLALERRWDAEKFAVVIDHIAQKYKLPVVMIGGPSEKDYTERCRRLVKNKSKVYNFSGETKNVKQLCYLLGKARFVLSNDSGPVHMANAMNVPVLAFFGPETPKLYGPIGPKNHVFYKNMPCSPCISIHNAKVVDCHIGVQCMKKIHSEEVVEQIDRMMG
ncbi:MAG: glycosyltransferase family 9 protein [Nanoarchaeota archaeon]